MKAIVTAKRVVDPYVSIRFNAESTAVDCSRLKMSMNPFDEIALEQAIVLKEQGVISEIILITIDQEVAVDILRHGLALGADKALLVSTDSSFDSLNIAKILRKIVEKEQPGLVLMGKQSIDGDNNQTPQMLAGLLDWPQATFASKIEIKAGKAKVTREIDGGLETILVQLPAVVSVDLRLNQPRYASLPNIMKAKQKPLEIIPLTDLSLDLKDSLEVINTTPPAIREAGIILDSVESLVEKLKYESKVL